MQKEIDGFNRAFVRLATGYVESLEAKIKGNATYSTEPQAIFRLGTPLADEVCVANVLAVTIGRMNKAQGGELPAAETCPADVEPPQDGAEPVTLGPGAKIDMNNPANLEAMIKKIVREMFAAWKEVNAACCINISREEAAEIEKAMQDAGPGKIESLEPDKPQNAPGGAWELLRDILAGKQPIPEGAVFNVTIDTGGNPQTVKANTEPDAPQEEN